jgi:hypothetical protein
LIVPHDQKQWVAGQPDNALTNLLNASFRVAETFGLCMGRSNQRGSNGLHLALGCESKPSG